MKETDIETIAADCIDCLNERTLNILDGKDHHEAGTFLTGGIILFSGKNSIAGYFVVGFPFKHFDYAEVAFIKHIHDKWYHSASAALKWKHTGITVTGYYGFISLFIVCTVYADSIRCDKAGCLVVFRIHACAICNTFNIQ